MLAEHQDGDLIPFGALGFQHAQRSQRLVGVPGQGEIHQDQLGTPEGRFPARGGPEGGKISLRCSPKYDAAAICARLGGGGHRGAAGASVPEGLDAAKKAILQAIADSGVEL